MARIRTIKPEFFTSEDIVRLSPMSRLLYIALWCEADREGRMQWKPRTFKMRYLPADSVDVDVLCGELVSSGLVKLYGDGLAFIPQFGKHQHVNPREAASSLPDPDDETTRHSRVSTRAITVTDAQVGKEGEGKEGKGTTSVPNGTGGDAAETGNPMTAAEIIFGYGVPILTSAGSSDKHARSFLAGLVKQHKEPAVVRAIQDCVKESPLQPLEWLAKRLPPRQAAGKQTVLESRNAAVLAEMLGAIHAGE